MVVYLVFIGLIALVPHDDGGVTAVILSPPEISHEAELVLFSPEGEVSERLGLEKVSGFLKGSAAPFPGGGETSVDGLGQVGKFLTFKFRSKQGGYSYFQVPLATENWETTKNGKSCFSKYPEDSDEIGDVAWIPKMESMDKGFGSAFNVECFDDFEKCGVVATLTIDAGSWETLHVLSRPVVKKKGKCNWNKKDVCDRKKKDECGCCSSGGCCVPQEKAGVELSLFDLADQRDNALFRRGRALAKAVVVRTVIDWPCAERGDSPVVIALSNGRQSSVSGLSHDSHFLEFFDLVKEGKVPKRKQSPFYVGSVFLEEDPSGKPFEEVFGENNGLPEGVLDFLSSISSHIECSGVQFKSIAQKPFPDFSKK